MESLGAGGFKKGSKAAPVANAFALGYTYQDVLDADHEGIAVQDDLRPMLMGLRLQMCSPAWACT